MARFLLTTLPTDDLQLLARSLAIARELAALGHQVLCSNPAPAPRRLIVDAGFENALPDSPQVDAAALLAAVRRALRARGLGEDFGPAAVPRGRHASSRRSPKAATTQVRLTVRRPLTQGIRSGLFP